MKKIILIFLVLILAVSTVFAASSISNFNDINNDEWYSDWVNSIKDLNITSGYPDGTFRPDNQLKRIELLSFTMKSLGYEIPVAKEYWGQNIIDKALEVGIIDNDLNDSMFTDPDGDVTREETARVIYNAFLKKNEPYNSEMEQLVKANISDIDSIDMMYLEGVVGVFSFGIVEGYEDKTFKPTNHLTRGEAAVFVSRLILPDRRKEVEFDLSVYNFNTTSLTLDSFSTYYSSEHQDIYNIMTIVDTVENANTDNGFASINQLSSESDHLMSLYSNIEDFDYTKVSNRNSYKRWDINVSKNPPSHNDSEWIEVISWRDKYELEHEETIRSVFNYLFAEDTERLWNKYTEMSNKPVKENVSTEYHTESFGRTVRIIASENDVRLLVSRKTDALPVIVEEGKVIVQYASILSDGTYGTVTFTDVKDSDSSP
ncbi:MAG: S-layer homology domain-containing protein [Clostridiales bacterium]|nr:S-layer homology domain-containing protein [Clostridiales bacterium]